MHKICNKLINQRSIYIDVISGRIDLLRMNLSFCCLIQKENKDLSGTDATFFFILTGILIEQINSCEINQDGQNVVGFVFFFLFFFLNDNSRFSHLVSFWETLTRHWNFFKHKKTKISSTQNVVKDLICVTDNMSLFMFLLEPENLEMLMSASRITEYHFKVSWPWWTGSLYMVFSDCWSTARSQTSLKFHPKVVKSNYHGKTPRNVLFSGSF